MSARLIHKGMMQEGGNPVGILTSSPFYLTLMAAAHHKQVADLAFPQVFAGLGRALLREDVHKAVIQGEDTLLHGKANGSGGKALAEREHDVGHIRPVGGPGALSTDLAVAQKHKAVHFNAFSVEPVQHSGDGSGGDAG